jgi:hypothetical protein
LSAIRQIHVVATRVDGSTCDAIVLTLEWSGSVDNGSYPLLRQDFVQLCTAHVEADGPIMSESKLLGHAVTTVTATAPDQKANGRVFGECAANACAKESVAAYDQDRVNADTIACRPEASLRDQASRHSSWTFDGVLFRKMM